MKKYLLFIIIVLISFPLFSNEKALVWSTLYRKAATETQKYEILQNLIGQQDRSMIPVFVEALDELNLKSMPADTTGKMLRIELKRALIKELGSLKADEGRAAVYRAAKDSEDPYLKADAYSALGRMRVPDFAEEFSIMLKNINNYTGTDRENNEIIAYGLLVYLENIKDMKTYENVFYASLSWYTPKRGVIKKAQRALVTMSDDPAGLLTGIILADNTYREKQAALEAAAASRSPAAAKNGAALAALQKGLLKRETDPVLKSRQLQLRITAINVLISNNYREAEGVTYLKTIANSFFEQQNDFNEILTSVTALSRNGSDAAVKVLSDLLKEMNSRQSSGTNRSPDNRFVISLIRALGDSRNKNAFEELARVQYSSWSTAVEREAREALAKLN
jgi:hypothetical protein